tara:strand:+ start:424 stop:1065 length:642 start_codon:yes stop_codon:yes gene_type:complete
MKYKDIMGYSKKQPKKKVVKEKLSPKKTILDGIKEELNEWSYRPPTEKRWSKKFNGSQGLTEFEKRVEKLKEGKLQEDLGWALDWESEIAQLINSKELKMSLKSPNRKIKTIAQRLRKNLISVHIGFDGLKDEVRRVYGEGKLNETLPAMAREWKGLEKACYDLEKAVKTLEKSVSRRDRKGAKTISGLWRYVEGPIKKFKKLLSKEVLDKLQ